MRLLEVLEGKGILRQLAQVHYQFAWHVELDTAAVSLLVSLEDHVHQDLKLRDLLFSTKCLITACWACSEWVVLRVVALEDDLALVKATAVHQRVKAVQEHSALWQRLSLADQVLTWDLDASAVEVGKQRTELLEVHRLVTRVDCGEEEVLEVLQAQEGLQDARLSSAFSQEVCRETRSECPKQW